MIKKRLNNKYLRVSMIKPHFFVKSFDKTSLLCFAIVILALCDEVTVTLFVHTLYKLGIKLNHETNRIVSKGGKFKSSTLLECFCTDKSKRTQ